jgi:uncharacterized protein YodC (DUF2158 family)
MDELKQGDVVQLKSGGPSMTIKEIGQYTYGGSGPLSANCTWFDGKKVFSEFFPLHALQKVSG